MTKHLPRGAIASGASFGRSSAGEGSKAGDGERPALLALAEVTVFIVDVIGRRAGVGAKADGGQEYGREALKELALEGHGVVAQ